jgi:hypothetical protein
MTTSYDIMIKIRHEGGIMEKCDTKVVPQVAPVASPLRTIDKRLVHKSYDENVLLSHIEAVRKSGEPEKVNKLMTSILGIAARYSGRSRIARNLSMILGRAMGRKDHFRGILYVHRDHSFFFEHERAHIPGMYLIEAIRQMSTAVAHMFYEVSFDLEFVMTECSAQFRNIANIDDPLIAELALSRLVYRKGRLVSMYGSTVVRQGNLEIAHMSGTMVFLSKSQLKYLEARGSKV